MSKTISGSLAAHFAQDSRTVVTLMKVTREDAMVYGFTNHDKTLTVSGVVYVPLSGFNPTAVATTSGMNVDNLDIVALIDSGVMASDEFSAGLFDFATIEVMQVNWADLSMGSITIRYGNLGELSLKNSTSAWQGELRGLMQRLQQSIGRLGAARCDADLGDARCTVNIAALTQTGAVATVGSRSNFTASGLAGADSLFNGGLLTWLTGANAGLAMEVKRSLTAGTIGLNLPMPYNIAVADTFTVYPGCDKNLATCRDTFNNVVNFRGFPTIPGRDRVLQYPDSPT